MRRQIIKNYFESHAKVMEQVAACLAADIDRLSTAIVTAIRHDKKILIMGNGGSAADAQHFAAEFVGRFLLERKALPAIALTTDTSILTAVGNDYGFDNIFRRQVEALAQPGDVVIGISTSGNSENVLLAMQAASEAGCVSVALLGRDGGRISNIVEIALTIPCQSTPHIQEAHAIIIHLVCDLVETTLFGKDGKD